MTRQRFTPAQRRRLHAALKRAHDARLYKRLLALVELDRGRSVTDVAAMLDTSRTSVYSWLDAFSDSSDPLSLQDRPRPGRPSLWTDTLQALLQEALERSPQLYGYEANDWTVPMLIDYLERVTAQTLSEDSIRRQLHQMGYCWKRPRYVLQPDPDLEKKAPHPTAAIPTGPTDAAVGRG